MKIVLSDSTEIPIVLNNTNFVDYWISKQFKNSDAVELILEKSEYEDILVQFTNAWEKFIDTITKVNNVITTLETERKLNRNMLFPLSNEPTTAYLEKIHEQWAQFTKDSATPGSSNWSQENLDVYQDINKHLRLTDNHYDNINNRVHDLEFLYKHMQIHNIKTTDYWRFPPGEYTVTAQDTTFDTQHLMIPYYDIGRPQYEKWAICKEVVHDEISNYINISTKLQLIIKKANITPPDEYINACRLKGVDAFGPNLGLGNFAIHNVDEAGFLILKEIINTNKLTLVK
jgi:hypothetical protein